MFNVLKTIFVLHKKASGTFDIQIYMIYRFPHKYSVLGAQATEGAHKSNCRVQKQATAASTTAAAASTAAAARLWYYNPRSFCTGGGLSHVSQNAWSDDDGPAGGTSNGAASWHDTPRWDACQNAPRSALYWRSPATAFWGSWSQWCQGPRSSWAFRRIFPSGAWSARCRP